MPATIAELSNPDTMRNSMCHTHERKDEALERLYL